MFSDSDDSARAVLFFDNNTIVAEMLYSEFESILDAFIPLPDFSGRTVQAAYLEINQQLQITAAVFFLIGFDAEGFPDKKWNVPLDTLITSAARGPNLGAGAIRLACYTQCPLPWLQRSLWDPEMSPGVDNFATLRKAISANKLRLKFRPPEPQALEDAIPTLTEIDERRYEKAWRQELDQEQESKLYARLRDRLADTLKKQRLRLATVRNKHRKRMDALNREHQARVDRFKAENSDLRDQLDKQNRQLSELKATLEGQADKMANIREYFEEKLKSVKSTGEGQIALLSQQFELESKAKIEATTTELKEQLQLKEIEVMYLTEHQKNLNDEIASLKAENQQTQAFDGDKFIGDLAAAGVTFVAYHTGLGHINIAKDELSQFMDNPESFAASKCGVSLPTYRAWLEHFTNPTCQAINKDGSCCGAHINRMTSPLDFHAGESDRCEAHKSNNVVQFQFGK